MVEGRAAILSLKKEVRKKTDFFFACASRIHDSNLADAANSAECFLHSKKCEWTF